MSANDPTQQTPPPPVVPRPSPAAPVNPTPASQLPPPENVGTTTATTALVEVAPHSSIEPIEGYDAFFCLESGARSAHRDLFELDRVFYVEPDFQGAPTCPRCKRQTSAVPLADASQLPPHLQAIKERLEKAERGSV